MYQWKTDWGDEGLLHIQNARLMNEVNWLRSELSSLAARSDAELWRAKALRDAKRAEASGASELLSMEASKNNLKTAEAAGLRSKLEESIMEKDDILAKRNMLKLKCIDREADNERLMHELEAKDARIKELSQHLVPEPIQPQENRRGAWTWFIPLTTVIVAAGTLVYVPN